MALNPDNEKYYSKNEWIRKHNRHTMAAEQHDAANWLTNQGVGFTGAIVSDTHGEMIQLPGTDGKGKKIPARLSYVWPGLEGKELEQLLQELENDLIDYTGTDCAGNTNQQTTHAKAWLFGCD